MKTLKSNILSLCIVIIATTMYSQTEQAPIDHDKATSIIVTNTSSGHDAAMKRIAEIKASRRGSHQSVEPSIQLNSREPVESVITLPEDAKTLAETQIREVVFQRLFKKSNTNQVYFISVGKTDDGKWLDAPTDFMGNLSSSDKVLRPASSSIIKRRTVVDTATGKTGSVYYVSIKKWWNDTTVDVEAGRYGGSLNARGFGARLINSNGVWVFKTYLGSWIS